MSDERMDMEGTAAEAVPSMRRIWQRPKKGQGANSITLKAFGVLYDAGQPLTVEDLRDQLLPRLSGPEASYLVAWCIRRQASEHLSNQRRRAGGAIVDKPSSTMAPLDSPDRAFALARWLKTVFTPRTAPSKGASLIRDPDGRLRPGARAPLALEADGITEVRYTPEARQRLDAEAHDLSRAHALAMEWDHVSAGLELKTFEARLRVLAFLCRRFAGPETPESEPVDERRLAPRFDHLLRHADTAGVKWTLLHRALEWGRSTAKEAK